MHQQEDVKKIFPKSCFSKIKSTFTFLNKILIGENDSNWDRIITVTNHFLLANMKNFLPAELNGETESAVWEKTNISGGKYLVFFFFSGGKSEV